MKPRIRLLAGGALAVVLAGFSVVVENPLGLLGAAAVGGWTVARQVAFAADLRRAVEGLTVNQSPDRETIRADETVTVTVTATLSAASSLRLSIAGGVPTTVTATDGERASPRVALDPGDTTVTERRPVRWPISGRHEFDPATVTATDGYLRETVTVPGAPTVAVEPRESDRIHVGVGGERLGGAYGDHESGRLDAGEDPAEPREYVPGDTADKIDWKATARLGTTYVREEETETDRRTTLVVDHRATLADGVAGRRKFDHLREVALEAAASAHRRGDPVGLVTVDDDGISSRFGHSTGGEYRALRRRLLDLEPSAATSAPGRRLTGEEARRRLTELTSAASAGDDPFVATLGPFYEDRASGIDRIAVDSLADGVRAAPNKQQRRRRTAIFTDDSRPGEVRETIALARGRGNDVLVFLTPTALYATAGGGLERTFERYAEFERFRRDLARMDQVTAMEVAPGDRLATVLAAGDAGGGSR